MFRRAFDRLSYANVMATVAVFVAIGGGAYAAGLGRDTVGSRQIKDDRVKSIDIKDDALTGADVDESKLELPEESGRIIARPHTESPQFSSAYPSTRSHPLEDSTWEQEAGTVNWVFGEIDYAAPEGCTDGTLLMNVAVSDGTTEQVSVEASGTYEFDPAPVMYEDEGRPLKATLDSTSFGCSGTPFEIEDARFAVVELR